MHVVVLGTGMIGTAVVKGLARYKEINKVSAIDAFQKNINNCLKAVNNPKVVGKKIDLSSKENIIKALKDVDLAIACLPHALSLPAIEAAIEAKSHLVDLVGTEYDKKAKLDQLAKDSEVIVVPGCGVAPGITNFLAARGIELLDEANEAVMICGGIPRYPAPPLMYQVVFRLESVMGLYTRPALAAENGSLIHLPALSGLEKIKFPEPIGECEAVITDAHSTAYTLKDKVKRIYEKTVRYKGHWNKMSILAQLGFFSSEEINIDGHKISPRRVSEKILEPQLKGESKEDVTVLRVVVEGKKEGKDKKYQWEMIDFYDQEREITSMAKTTAVPAKLMAKWILTDKISERGIVPVENLIIGERFDPFINELNESGIIINQLS